MNDPVAILLTVGMVEVWRADPTVWDWTSFLASQLGIGAFVGLTIGATKALWAVTMTAYITGTSTRKVDDPGRVGPSRFVASSLVGA